MTHPISSFYYQSHLTGIVEVQRGSYSVQTDHDLICGICGENITRGDCNCDVDIMAELKGNDFFLCDEPASNDLLFHYIRENEDGTIERISSPSCQSFKNWLFPKATYTRFDSNSNIVDRREFPNVLSFVEWFTK